jgi:hypothetical protein
LRLVDERTDGVGEHFAFGIRAQQFTQPFLVVALRIEPGAVLSQRE